MTTVLVTGADGFIGRNLCLRLAERGAGVVRLGRGHGSAQLADAARRAEFVFHLGGVNRPNDPSEFASGNIGLAESLCAALSGEANHCPIVYTSSIQATADNLYGASKRAAEDVLLAHGRATGAPIHLFRLPNVFGKWARPNYNSAVATFCYRVARGEEITVHDPAAPLALAYVDDVVESFLRVLDNPSEPSGFHEIPQVYRTTVGEIATMIQGFPVARDTLIIPPLGAGLYRALHATYLSYLPPTDFAYTVPVYGKEDPRGPFVEMLKTRDAGQFSYFIAHPGVTRGDHYHHSKTEKFLVIAGTAHFGFRQVITGETYQLVVNGGEGRIVESIPGWTHNVTNIGKVDLICMLWANEIFDRDRPDTVWMQV